jgi:hypothetical protein
MRQLMPSRPVATFCVLVCVIAGCSSYRSPSLPEDETAKLSVSDPCLKLQKVDGKSLPLGQWAVILAPGPHDLDMLFYRMTSGEFLSTRTERAECRLYLNALAGREYTLKCLLVGYEMVFWIEDASDGQTVAGVRPEFPQRTGPNAAPASR